MSNDTNEEADMIDQTPNKAVAVFEDHGVQIYIFTKKNESIDDAIARVAKHHHVPETKVKRLKK